jgi:hypothetical protein
MHIQLLVIEGMDIQISSAGKDNNVYSFLGEPTQISSSYFRKLNDLPSFLQIDQGDNNDVKWPLGSNMILVIGFRHVL